MNKEKVKQAITAVLASLHITELSGDAGLVDPQTLLETIYLRGYEDGGRDKYLELTTKTSPQPE